MTAVGARPCFALFGVLVALVGCASNHAALERKPDASASSATAGSGGAAGSVAAASSGSGGGGGTGPVEPEVPTELTLVNGVADADSAAFCFVRNPAGEDGAMPWPSASGLAFAHAAKVDVAALGLGGNDLEVKVVVGDATALGAKTCKQLDGAPGIVMRSLAVVPASVLDEPRRLVLVATGCIGGETHVGPEGPLACGQAYAPDQPTAGLVAGFLSSLGEPTALRMQLVHGVVALSSPASVGVAPGIDGAMLATVASNWTYGAFAPNTPDDALAVGDIVDAAKARIAVSSSNGSGEVALAEALANGGVKVGGLQNGDGLALVAVGARPGLPKGAWWQAFTFVALHTPK